ncbi:hypothetical protein AVEN_253983-1 [Araneus ventricosus]|uniref:Uncharacterized protein n=1 Tax=Araneus ventricosus TaxID=182803 RepID=A0A4Y2GR75_ARAVE|nr:hypothetical protein AVEN_253983-1 [Araneus ventricosus]
MTQLFSALPKSEPRSRLPNRFFTALLSLMSNTPALFVPEGWSSASLSFHWTTETPMRPTTKHLSSQWSISTPEMVPGFPNHKSYAGVP